MEVHLWWLGINHRISPKMTLKDKEVEDMVEVVVEVGMNK